MTKDLYSMTKEELWQLFPIKLTPYNKEWPEQFCEMKNTLGITYKGLGIKRIEHIGSTAVKNLWAKPIVDILVELYEWENFERVIELSKKFGFRLVDTDNNRVFMNYGYTENGFAHKVYHLHIREKGDIDELYFRDYLIENKRIAREYKNLKLALWKIFEHNRDGYTFSKTAFIKKYTAIAKTLYKDRY